MNSNTSAGVTSTGSLSITAKNTFRSDTVANTVFGRHLAEQGPHPDRLGARDSQARYNDAHAVVHAECPPPVELAASHGVCSTCFMALPATGVCDDCG